MIEKPQGVKVNTQPTKTSVTKSQTNITVQNSTPRTSISSDQVKLNSDTDKSNIISKSQLSKLQPESKAQPDPLEKLLNSPDFRNISDEEAAKMLGYFSKTMRSKGFPWVYKAKINGKLKEISDLEVLFKLKRGETVYFYPKRIVNINLSGTDLEKLAKLSPESTALKNLSKALKDREGAAKLDEPIGREVSDGGAIPVKSYAELKLLYQLFNPSAKLQTDSETAKTLKAMTKFVVEKFGSKYPWRFYSAKASLKDKIEGFFRVAGKKILIGGLIGFAFSSPILILASLLSDIPLTETLGTGMLAATVIGAGIGTLYGLKDGLHEAKLGKEIGPIEALRRLMRGQNVKFQQKKVHSMTFPIVNKVVWQTNYRQPVTVKNADDLILLKDVYYGDQN